MTDTPPTVLLYDWDNTLVDGWAGITAALNAVFAAFDKPLWTVEDTRNRVRVSLRESFPSPFASAVFQTSSAGGTLTLLPGSLTGAPYPFT